MGGTGLGLYLTHHVLDVLCLLADGHGNKEIAHTLSVSVSTVKVHVQTYLRSAVPPAAPSRWSRRCARGCCWLPTSNRKLYDVPHIR